MDKKNKNFMLIVIIVIFILIAVAVYLYKNISGSVVFEDISADIKNNNGIVDQIVLTKTYNNKLHILFTTKDGNIGIAVYEKVIFNRYRKKLIQFGSEKRPYRTDLFTKGYRNKVIVSFFLAGINVDNNIAYVKVTLGNESFTDNIAGKYFIVARDITFDSEHKRVVPIIKFYNERDEEISLD